MLPRTPLERLHRFTPSFCPREDCPQHRLPEGAPYAWRKAGTYRTKRGERQRYLCKCCRRTFSKQAFSTRYWMKRPELLTKVAAAIVSCSSHRQIGRQLGCAHTTVTRLLQRIARHSILLQRETLKRVPPIREAVVFDHFVSFEYSQDLPIGIGTPVGWKSKFLYGIDPISGRRKGRMSPKQKARQRFVPRRPTRGGPQGSLTRTIDFLLGKTRDEDGLTLYSDDDPGFTQAVRKHPQSGRIAHFVHANPERGPKGDPRTDVARARDAALNPVDALHHLVRHSASAHKRETIAHCKRLQGALERFHIKVVWRNLVKWRSEHKPDKTTPAMQLGVTDEVWKWTRVLSVRLFRKRVGLDGYEGKVYRREVDTPGLKPCRRHRLRFAF